MKKFVLFVIFCNIVNCSSLFSQTCEKQLFDIGYSYVEKGCVCVYEQYNSLEEDYYRQHKIFLNAGLNYDIVAVCDNDCSDIDLQLYDGNENLVVQDTSDDDIPLISFYVTNSGYFTLKITMCDCDTEPCKYGIAVFKK